MESVEIKCKTCSEVMGTISKGEVTEQDQNNYSQMITCSSGHKDSSLEEKISDSNPEETFS